MWAVIGMYGGQEDNAFFRRVPGSLERAGGRELPAGEVLVLGEDAIHSVANSRKDFAVALHVYGGDFFSVERSEWDFETYEERPRGLRTHSAPLRRGQRPLARTLLIKGSERR